MEQNNQSILKLVNEVAEDLYKANMITEEARNTFREICSYNI